VPFAEDGAARLHYREFGRELGREFGAATLVFLHGGWGYEVYPFDRAVAALESQFHILIPDRSGYGRSPEIESLPGGFSLARGGGDHSVSRRAGDRSRRSVGA